MTMKTLLEIPTQADHSTLPGGIALRYHAGHREFIVHNFNTDRESGTSRAYWQGSYCSTLGRALEVLAERVKRAERYDTGGALDFVKLIGFEAMPAGEVIARA